MRLRLQVGYVDWGMSHNAARVKWSSDMKLGAPVLDGEIVSSGVYPGTRAQPHPWLCYSSHR